MRRHREVAWRSRRAESPRGDHVTLLQLDFLVQDPDEPGGYGAKAGCDVEVSAELAMRSDVGGLRAGAAVFVAGQLSEREIVEGGITIRRGVIVAALIKGGPPPSRASGD